MKFIAEQRNRISAKWLVSRVMPNIPLGITHAP
jgi:hypothetical protein